MDWRWERRGEWDDDDEVSARGDGKPAGEPEGELAYALGLTPSEAAIGCSRSSIYGCGEYEGSWALGFSVTVLDDVREGDNGGGGAAFGLSTGWRCGGGEAASSSSVSGLAMRRPPSVCDRLRSPFIVPAAGQLWR